MATPDMASQYGAQQQYGREQAAAAVAAVRAARRARRGKPSKPNGARGSGAPSPDRAPKPPVDPYRRDVRAAARLRYGGEERALEQELAQSAVNQQNNTTWFQQYQDQLEKSRIAQASFYQGQVAGAGQMAAQTGPANTNPEGQQLTGDSAAAGSVRQAIQEGFAEALRQQGITFNAAKEDQKGVASASQLTARQAEQRRADQVRSEQRELKQDKGAFKTQYRTQLMDDEHRRRLETAAFGLDQYQAEQSAANDRAARRAARRGARQDARAEGDKVNEYGYSNRDWGAMTPQQRQAIIKDSKTWGDRSGGSAGQFSPKERRSNRITLRKAIAKVRQNDNGLEDYWRDAQRGMIGADVDPVIARIAARVGTGQPIPKSLARQLWKDYGIKVKTKAVKRPEPSTPFPEDSPGSDAAQG